MNRPTTITAPVTIEIGGKEYAATVSATVYSGHAATRDDNGGVIEVQIESISLYSDKTEKGFYRGVNLYSDHITYIAKIGSKNLDRCLEAVNAKIEY